MSAAVLEQARFAAREFVARWERETGSKLQPDTAHELMLFAYEMGYVRGHGEGMRAAGALLDEVLP